MELFKADMSGVKRLETAMRDAARKTGDPRSVLKFVSLLAEQAVKHNFDVGRTPDGQKWKKLKHRIGGSPLVNHGHMRDGITHDFPTKSSLRIGAGSPTRAFNAIHNFGGLSWMAPGPRAIPARKYMGFSRERLDRIIRELVRFTMDRLKGRS